VLLAVIGLGGGSYLIISANGRRARTDYGIALLIIGTVVVAVVLLGEFLGRLARLGP
jgi:hypothetical protein